MQFNWSDNALTVTHETQTFDESGGQINQEIHGQITASGEEWLEIAVTALAMLPGKLNDEGTGHILAPADADPDMIGSLVAAMLRDRLPGQR